jgi:hypothetical protein
MGIKASKNKNLDNFIARTALWNSGELVIGLIKAPSLKNKCKYLVQKRWKGRINLTSEKPSKVNQDKLQNSCCQVTGLRDPYQSTHCAVSQGLQALTYKRYTNPLRLLKAPDNRWQDFRKFYVFYQKWPGLAYF